MSLATRCPACGTAFRVVQDQLRVSGGWVRCGMCQQVFNGLEALIAEPPESAPPQAPPRPPVAQPPAAVAAPPAIVPAPAPQPRTEPAPEPMRSVIPTGEAWEADAGWSMFGPGVGVGATGTAAGDSLSAPSLPPSDFDPVLRGVTLPPGHSGISTFGEVTAATAQRQPVTRPPKDLRVDPPPSGRRRRRKPGFVRQAEREAQWRTPAMRAVLGGTAALLSGVLLLQVAHHERDRLAAHWPTSVPVLQAWCELARCRLEPIRAIDQLAIDSSTLQRTAAPDVLRFEAELRNQAAHPVRAPDLELSFTDNQGRLLARRVLPAASLDAPAAGIAADAHWSVRAELRVRDLPVTGFSAELFYP